MVKAVVRQMRFWQLTITQYKSYTTLHVGDIPKKTKLIQSSVMELFLCVYSLFSMTDLYHGHGCLQRAHFLFVLECPLSGLGFSEFDSVLWEINGVVLILSARLHQVCV